MIKEENDMRMQRTLAFRSIRQRTSGAMLRREMAGWEWRVGTSQLPSLAHVLMKIGVPRACTAKACASRGRDWAELLGTASRAGLYRQDPH
ncbi:hypothetical protein F2Q68_00010773 [Brassica cretica]|uniref:Uncharacterized protein n=1 Tax=Brassica cretica TaxID=69181 RepID=A0A8S9L3I7_BRACR|nr:hypothetical protein F2Q68_00010773 [Brassica cretica]